MTPPSAGATRPAARRPLVLVALVLAVVVQLLAVYSPDAGGGPPPFPAADKVVHAAIFAAPVLLAILAGLRSAPVVAVFAVHAPLSEFVQYALLPHRDGDGWDAAADLVGVGLGWLLALLALRGPTRSLIS